MLNDLQKTIIAQSNQNGKTNKYQDQMAALNKMRDAMRGNISTLDTYRMRQGQVLSSEDAWSKKIREGKATFGDMVKNRSMFNSVLKDQLALQKAVGLSWTQNSKTGKFSADMYIPKTMPEELNNFKNRVGLFNQMLNSSAGELVNWGKNTQWAGRQLMVGFTVPIGIAAGAMGKMAYDLDKAVTQVVKVYGDASSQFSQSTADIRSTAVATAEAAARVYGQSAKDTLGIMADLAASGKSGMELQQATMATTRAAILGELDWQDAVKATISMQSVYHSSQEDLANNWNYINAMENQTVLSAQDFVTAIPKVSGVMNELGADLKQTGTLLTAFKAAGIDAAEGANALKSINFRTVAAYGKGVDTFNAATGKDLKALVESTNGETIPTLMKFADAIKNLSTTNRMAVVRDVFGIYQGSKALMLLEQMTQKTDQWQQAMDVANNSVIENAAIAQQELDRQSEQPFKKLQMAIESVKINLAKIGESFLGPAAFLVGLVDKIIKGFNDLNPAVKITLGVIGGILAIAGPITMMIGLFANLIGTLVKLGSRIVLQANGFKMLSEEERLQQIVGSKTGAIWDAETTAAARLTLALHELAMGLAEVNAVNNKSKKQVFIGPLTKAETDAKAAKAARKIDQPRADFIYNQKYGNEEYKPKYKPNKNGKLYEAATGYNVDQSKAIKENARAEKAYERLTARRRADAMAQAQQERAANELAAAQRAETKAAEEASARTTAAENRTRRLTSVVSGAALGIGIMATELGNLTGASDTAIMAINGVATVGMLAPGFFVKAAKTVGGWGKSIGSAVATAAAGMPRLASVGTTVMNGIKTTASSMLGYLKVAGPIVAAVGIAAFLLIQRWNNEIDKQKKKTEDALNFAKNTADILGYSYTNTAGLDPNNIKDGQKATEVIAAKIKEKNPEQAANFADEAFSQDAGKSTGEKYGAAIAAGIDAKMHGATVDQAKATVRAAVQIMGQSFSTDAQFEAWITPKINFDSANDMMKKQGEIWKNQIQTAFTEKPLNLGEQIMNGDTQISQDAQVRITKIGTDMWDMLYATPKGDRRAMIEKIANENDKFMNDAYQKAMKNNPTLMKNMGVNNAHDFAGAINNGNIMATDIGMSTDDFNGLAKRADGLKQLTKSMAMASGVSEEAASQMQVLWDLMNPQFAGNTFVGYLDEAAKATDQAAGNTSDYDIAINGVIQSGKVMTTQKFQQIQQDIRIADGTYKMGAAMQYFGDVTAGASVSADDFNSKLKEMGFNSTVSLDSAIASAKNVMSGAQDYVFAEAARQYDEQMSAQMDALQASGQAKLDALDKQGEALDKKQEKQQKAQDDRQKKAQDAFDKGQNARKKKEEDLWDARLKAVDDQVKAEQKAEDMRQKIFEAEQTRIQRLADMYSTNIDINMAINSGQMDEAAKLVSNAQSQVDQWNTSDAAGDSKSASDKRIEDLNAKKDNISKQKDAALEALNEQQDAEKEAFKATQDRQKQQLKDTQDAEKKKLDAQKKRIQAQNAQAEKQLRDDQARNKRNLDSQLAEMRAFLPKNEAQLRAQATALQGVYAEFGGKLTGMGDKWGGVVGLALKTNVAKEGNALKSAVNWTNVGKDIANAMINGAFGMSAKQFSVWLNGGEAPVGSIMADPKKKPIIPKHAGQLNASWESRHAGGVIGSGLGSRVGYSGKQKPSEVMINALRGEGVVNRKGMKVLGKAGLDNINSGGGIGGGGLHAMSQGVPGMLAGFTNRVVIQGAIASAYKKRMGLESESVGKNVGIKGPSVVDSASGAIGNALDSFAGMFGSAPNMSGPIYKTGTVVYLGHNDVNAGGDYSGLVRPVIGGYIASEFGPRNLFGMSYHNGIDIMSPTGTPIRAAKGGRVIFTGPEDTGYGNYTEIQASDGSMYGYGHQSAIGVRAGMNVATGQMIGRVGSTGHSTGPHLHFQIGNHGNWFNPRKVMPQLDTGGFIQNDGLAKLHKEEVVVTKPLTKKFEQGVNNFAEGGNATYNVTLDFNGASFDRGIDFQGEVETALRNIDRKQGGNRKIGGR